MLDKIVSNLVPPIFVKLYEKVWSSARDNPDQLFDKQDDLFKETVQDAQVYGEYGLGKSTKWVLDNTAAQVIAVDSSADWVAQVQHENADHKARLDIKYIDVGRVGGWGRPLGYENRDAFQEYTDHLWQQSAKPNVVLIDGRFRVCCFLTVLKFADPGTKILFDDYTDRPYYHLVEKYVPRLKTCGRQCLFEVPPKSDIDLDALDQDIHAFRLVME